MTLSQADLERWTLAALQAQTRKQADTATDANAMSAIDPILVTTDPSNPTDDSDKETNG